MRRATGVPVLAALLAVAGGPDGSIALARGELDYAAGLRASCGLVVGQQYGAVEPATITEAFSGHRQFRGLAVDDLDAYMNAKP